MAAALPHNQANKRGELRSPDDRPQEAEADLPHQYVACMAFPDRNLLLGR